MERTMQQTSIDKLFIIAYGLGGGFGGANKFEVIEAKNEDEAGLIAWEKACEEYESYSGMYGLKSLSQVMEENEIDDEDEALPYYKEEREGWLDYWAKPYSKEYEKKVIGADYQNAYKAITG